MNEPNKNQQTLTVDGRDYIVRWRAVSGPNSFTGSESGLTGTIDEYRLPHLHDSVEHLLFCAYEWAKAGEQHRENCLGKPVDIEAFING